MSVLSNDLPRISHEERLMPPLVGSPIVDQSTRFELPFQLEDLPRMSELYENEGIELGSRTPTERRSYTYPPVVFQRLNPVIRNEVIPKVRYCDLQIKGGGAIIPPNVLMYRKEKKPLFQRYDPSKALPTHIQLDDGVAPVRFTTDRLVALSDELGFIYEKNELTDLAITEYLESQFGLRTRSLVAMWEIPEDVEVVTPEGIQSIHDVKMKLYGNPVLDAWSLRCKYRVLDPLRMVYELEAGDPEPDDIGMKLRYAGLPMDFIRKNKDDQNKFLSHDPQNNFLNDEQKAHCLEQYCDLAKQIIGRAIHDDDGRFVELGERYQSVMEIHSVDSEAKTVIEHFYKDYLYVFSSVLGEQFGIMEEADAISGMMNLQNITLLAELVDNDVTLIHGKTMQFDENGNPQFVDPDPKDLKEYAYDPKDNALNFVRQLHIGWQAISLLIRDLSRTGVISIDEQVLNNRNVFLDSYANHLRNHLSHQEYAEKMATAEWRTNFLVEDFGFTYYDSFYSQRIDPQDILGEGERFAFLNAFHEFSNSA